MKRNRKRDGRLTMPTKVLRNAPRVPAGAPRQRVKIPEERYCNVERKWRYMTRLGAEQQLRRIGGRGGVYLCGDCGGWHVTSGRGMRQR